MARYDKYDFVAGGFRAVLAVAITPTSGSGSTSQVGVPLAMGLDANGLAIVGTTGSAVGVVGVYVADQAKAIGDVVDIMTAGEIVDLDEAVFDPGKTYYAATGTGAISATAAATSTKIGVTVGDKSLTTGAITSRLIVRAGQPDSIGAS